MVFTIFDDTKKILDEILAEILFYKIMVILFNPFFANV